MTWESRLLHSSCAGQARHTAILDDYAYMARAYLALFEATSDASYLRDAEVYVETAYLITRTKNASDHATPYGQHEPS